MSAVLLVGGGGQVGQELARAEWPVGTRLTVTDRSSLDITNGADVAAVVASTGPDFIVNAAAYTAVDRAEDESDQAFAVNETAVGHLATAAESANATLIHISTDYVFDGSVDGWYSEDDEPNPVGVYGKSKLAGERAALESERAVVLRTSWVYGALQPNFVITMRRLALERDELGVVADQFGCPTAAAEIAKAIVKIVHQGAETPGVFHLAAPDDASWWDLATAAIEAIRPPRTPSVHRLTTAEFPTKAARPANSRLDTRKIKAEYGIRLPNWRHSLRYVSEELNDLSRADPPGTVAQ